MALCVRCASAALVCVGVLSGRAVAEPMFPGLHYWVTVASLALDSGDLNGDGFVDIAFSDRLFARVGVCFGRGDGSFAAPVFADVWPEPSDVEIGDLDDDGFPDIVVTHNAGGSIAVTMLPGLGAGLLGEPVTLLEPGNQHHVELVDANADGLLDMASVRVGGYLYLRYNDGNLGFETYDRFMMGEDTWQVDWGDLNGDGALDFVTANFESDDVGILLSDGAGGYAEPFTFASGDGTSDVEIVDIDGDGDLDIVACNAWAGSLSMIVNLGSGFFLGPYTLPTGGDPRQVHSTDLGRDGVTDLLVTSGSEGRIDVFRGSGSGNFLPRVSLDVVTPIWDAQMVDLDCDTIEDIVFMGQNLAYLSAGFVKDDGSISLPAAYELGGLPEVIGAGDFNGDGRDDLAIGMDGGESLDIMLSDAGGVLRLAHSYPLGEVARDIRVEDLDSDGAVDVLIGFLSAAPDPVAMVYSGNGDGSFVRTAVLSAPNGSREIGLGDVNGDGLTDIVAPWFGPAELAVWLGTGPRTFGEVVTHETAARPDGVCVVDLNGDGADEVLVPSLFDDVVEVFAGSPGGLGAPMRYPVIDQPNDIDVADLNDDGLLDMLVCSQGRDLVAVFYGDGMGGFVPSGRAAVVQNPFGVDAADFDLDGHLDLLVWRRNTLTSDQHYELHPGLGGGSFGEPMLLDTGRGPRDAGVGDFDGDGYPDFATIGAGDLQMRVFLNTRSRARCSADLDANGELNLQDVQLFVGYFADGNLCADVDADGTLSFFDIAGFIRAWLDGCDSL